PFGVLERIELRRWSIDHEPDAVCSVLLRSGSWCDICGFGLAEGDPSGECRHSHQFVSPECGTGREYTEQLAQQCCAKCWGADRKETPSASQSENSPAAPTPRKDADANGANATLDLASSSVAPVVATPAPAAPVPVAVVPQSSVPAVAGDPLPKADGTQAGAENLGTSIT